MKRIMLITAYDGTNYSGWQLQPGKETIEGVINGVLSEFLNENIRVIGASRTDSGVHAEGAVCVFDTNSSIPGNKFCFAINKFLPEDIRIMSSSEVDCDFHPRKVKCRKTYRYRIYHGKIMSPTKRLYYHHVYTQLNIELMRTAAKELVGTHDFAAFCSSGSQSDTTIRTIYSIDITENGNELFIDVCGNGFLYNMVRIIAGTLIETGQGKYNILDVQAMLTEGKREKAGQTAPAKGLCLMKYEYEQ